MEKRDFNLLGNNNPDFINSNNSEEVLKVLQDTARKVIECLLMNNQKAFINSEISVENLKKELSLGKFPDKGNKKTIDESIEMVLSNIIPNFSSNNYFGHMLTSMNIGSIVSSNVANILNQNIIAQEVGPLFTQMENVVIGYLADLIGYDLNTAGGTITSGGTSANHTALLVARNKLLPGVTERGLGLSIQKYNELNNTQYKNVVYLYGEDSHYSIEKMGGYIGVGTENVIKIPYKEGTSQLDIENLKDIIKECELNGSLIVGIVVTAGTTEKGHVHEIQSVSEIAKVGQNGRKIYLHVDAAHGGGFLVNSTLKETIFAGIENADSVTMDGHKMFFTNYSCGGIIFKDKNDMEYIKHSADYVIPKDTTHDNHGAYTIEGSRGAAGVYQLYTNINSLGKSGYDFYIQQLIHNKQYMEYKLQENADYFEILNQGSPLNLVCFRISIPGLSETRCDEIYTIIKNKMMQDGIYYVSSTVIDGYKSFRSVFMNPNDVKENIDNFISYMMEIIKENIS